MALKADSLTVHKVESEKELYDLWPRIREGIEIVLKRGKELRYRPEDCYHAIKSGNAQLFVCTLDSRYSGFFITRLDSHPDGQCLHIWVLHSLGSVSDFTDQLFRIIGEIKRLIGAIRFSFSSSRKGWIKKAERKGYKPTSVLYYYED